MLGVIGVGNMGMAIAHRVKERVILSDKDTAKLKKAADRGFRTLKGNKELANKAGTLILAVKPQDINSVVSEIRDVISNQLILSIAAGVKTSRLERLFGSRVRIVRVMPNMAAVVGFSMSALCKGRFATLRDIRQAERIFSSIGEVVRVKEGLMDAVTAVSGSGPAYYFLFTLLLARAGVKLGLSSGLAQRLSVGTFKGAAALLDSDQIDIERLISMVASKGGTTEAALRVFDKAGLPRILRKAASAAKKRSSELSK